MLLVRKDEKPDRSHSLRASRSQPGKSGSCPSFHLGNYPAERAPRMACPSPTCSARCPPCIKWFSLPSIISFLLPHEHVRMSIQALIQSRLLGRIDLRFPRICSNSVFPYLPSASMRPTRVDSTRPISVSQSRYRFSDVNRTVVLSPAVYALRVSGYPPSVQFDQEVGKVEEMARDG